MTEIWDWVFGNTWGSNFTSGIAAVIVVAIASRIPAVRRNVTPHVKAFVKAVPTLRISTASTRAKQRAGAMQQGRDEVENRVAGERSASALKPAWAVERYSNELPNDHLLINYEVDVVATDVRLTAPIELFGIDGAARWPEIEHILNLHRRQVHFQGMLKGAGVEAGVTFEIAYTDANGDRQTGHAFLDAAPPAPARIATAVHRTISRSAGR